MNTPPPLKQFLSDQQILYNVLSYQLAKFPTLASFVLSIAHVYCNFFPFEFLQLLDRPALELAVLYNSVAASHSIADHHFYLHSTIALIHPPIPIDDYMDVELPQDIVFLYDDFVPDLTTQGIEPNPGPSPSFIPRPEDHVYFEPAHPIQFAPAAPQVPLTFFQVVMLFISIMSPYQFVMFLCIMPCSAIYSAIATLLNRFWYPQNAQIRVTAPPSLLLGCWYIIVLAISSLATHLAKSLVLTLLLRAGIEPNPGPYTKSDPALSCESPTTQSVEFSTDFQRSNIRSRSKEKRNSKLSKRMLNDLLESHRRQKTLSCVRSHQRMYKHSCLGSESFSMPVIPHNSRRLEKFLESKKNTIRPNGLLSKLSVRCCADKKDRIFVFLTSSCHLDEFVAMALTPVIKAIETMLTSKISIAIALALFIYHLAKYVSLPLPIVAPVVSLVLTFLIPSIHKSIISNAVSLYEYISKQLEIASETLVHSADVPIDQNSFEYIDEVTVEHILLLNFSSPYWRRHAITFCMHHPLNKGRHSWSTRVPAFVYKLLAQIDKTKLDPRFLQDLLNHVRPNVFTEACVDITTHIRDLFSGVGLLSSTFQLPSALFFYSSTKKFVKQIYEIFTDLYPSIYEFITGKNYIAPEVAKYLAVFGDICKKVHATLRESRQTNVVRESADFRLRVVVEYEALLETQMKLIEMKAPPTYMVPVNQLIREMSSLANDCYNRCKGEAAREEPVLIFVRGPPGTGKTTVDHALALIIAKRLGIKVSPNIDFFQRDAGTEFYDGYENQLFVVLDDAFQLTDPVKQAATILEVIKMKNTAPYKLVMAKLEDKRNSFFNSKFVFISTNVENIVCDQVADIGAFYRRIDFDVIVRSLPEPNADGSPNFDYDLSVNGLNTTIPILADSIVALHRKRSNADRNVAQALVRFADSVPPCPIQDLIPARNSVIDFEGHDDTKYKKPCVRPTRKAPSPPHQRFPPAPDRAHAAAVPLPQLEELILGNGLVEAFHIASSKFAVARKTVSSTYSNLINWGFNPINYKNPLLQSVLSQVSIDEFLLARQDFVKWVSIFAISTSAIWLLVKLFKSLSQSVFPNSKKVKDKLTGDKPNVVSTPKQQIKEHLKSVQAKMDKKVVAKQILRPNSSSERWSASMISYIESQGWQTQQWVADSLASIQDIDDLEYTEQEANDLSVLRTNVVDIFTYYKVGHEGFKMYGKALLLNQNTVIATSHQIPGNCEILSLEVLMGDKNINIRNCKIDRIPNSDTCIITLTTLLPCRDISYMFSPLSEITAKDSQVYLLRNFEDTLTICPVMSFTPTDRVISYETETNEVIECGSIFECKVAVCTGDSGCFYVVRDLGRFKIVGMHIASSFYSAHGRFISREMLKGYIKPARVASTPFDAVKRAVESNSRSFDERLACNSNCVAIGIVAPRTMIAARSKINRSILYHHKLLPPLTEFPADLRRTYTQDDPLLKANSKFRLRDEPLIEPSLQEEIIHALLDEHPNLPTKTFYSNIEAIEGTKDMPKISMTTSSGYPYSAIGKTPKTKLDEQDWIDICRETDNMLEDLYNGHMPQAIFQTSFKDEIRPLEKVKNPRVINCAPTSLTLLFRRVLGPWMNMIHANHAKLSTKVGINAHGVDWKIFYDNLVAISPDNIVELDYSGYEYNHPQFAFFLAAEFLYRLFKRSGFSERDSKAVRLLVLSCAAGFVIQNDVLIFIWMLLSGLPITAELNSLLNDIYQKVCYRKLTNLPLTEMRNNVCSGYYGDDLLHSVHDRIKHLFNSITIQQFCQDFLSMKVTPASNKSGLIAPFVSILECSFLCRRFCPRENRVDAPLKLSASTDSLQYYNPVAHMTQRELVASKCRSFITELTHQPPEIFNHWSSVLAQIKAQHGLNFINYDYSTALYRRITIGEED
jgi:hypothetical protein